AGPGRNLAGGHRRAPAAGAGVVAGAPADPGAGPERRGARDHARQPARLRAVHVPRGDRDRAPGGRGHRQRRAGAGRTRARPALGRRAGVPAVPGRRGGARTAAAAAAVMPMMMPTLVFPTPFALLSFGIPNWLAAWLVFLPPLGALGAAALVRRAHARAGEMQPWLDAAVVGLTLVPLAVVVAWPALPLPPRAA